MDQENKIKLPRLVSNGMVLQRKEMVRIWGWAVPGENLLIKFLEKEYTKVVAEDGSWEIQLTDMEAGGPYEMEIYCLEDKRILTDLYVGDVWVLGGQSNMELPIRRTLDLFEEEVKGVSYPGIRKFSVPQQYDFHGPVSELEGGSWESVTPDSVYDFSAVGFFFAKNLFDHYHIPIGLIHTAIGGTPAEAWVSEKSLLRFGRFQELLSLCKDDAYVNGTKQREELRNNEWYTDLYKKDPGLKEEKGEWFLEDYDDSAWGEMELPGSFQGTELEKLKGSVWFRKEIFLTDEMLHNKVKLILGTIIDGDDTYINGVRVGSTGYLYPPRRYDIPEGLLKAGRNVLVVRVILTQNIGAFVTDMPYYLKSNGHQIPIDGIWKYRIGAVIDAQLPTTFFQYKPTGVYNGMIYPLRNYSIKGVLWYQGESNGGYPYDYKELFHAVIKDWRSLWGLGDFPFLYVQLANYCPWRLEPEISGWARIREEQRKALCIPNTGMVVTVDVGEYNDLHPQDKKSVGERLTLWARNMVFGETAICSGPIYNEMQKEGNKIRLSFQYTGSGLQAKGGVLRSFTICGKDGIFRPANAVIEGETVVVFSEQVPVPVDVQYAWSDNPEEANLYNIEGLPASPFTTRK